jgi:uncharacterized protein YjbI with pentapeptide repeats
LRLHIDAHITCGSGARAAKIPKTGGQHHKTTKFADDLRKYNQRQVHFCNILLHGYSILVGPMKNPDYFNSIKPKFATKVSHLTGSHLTGSHLTGSHLTGSHLTGSQLMSSLLVENYLVSKSLTRNSLLGALKIIDFSVLMILEVFRYFRC